MKNTLHACEEDFHIALGQKNTNRLETQVSGSDNEEQ